MGAKSGTMHLPDGVLILRALRTKDYVIFVGKKPELTRSEIRNYIEVIDPARKIPESTLMWEIVLLLRENIIDSKNGPFLPGTKQHDKVFFMV